jgi:hypothetical protein
MQSMQPPEHVYEDPGFAGATLWVLHRTVTVPLQTVQPGLQEVVHSSIKTHISHTDIKSRRNLRGTQHSISYNRQQLIPPFNVFILRMNNQKTSICNTLATKYLNNPFAVARKSPTWYTPHKWPCVFHKRYEICYNLNNRTISNQIECSLAIQSGKTDKHLNNYNQHALQTLDENLSNLR